MSFATIIHPNTTTVVQSQTQTILAEERDLTRWFNEGKTKVFTINAMITPEIASRLLSRNTANRPICQFGAVRSVSAYAAAMARGEWALNGEALIFSKDGLLNDGQHRLMAVVQAKVAVVFSITFGVERDTRHTVDQGVARSPGHILAMAGEKNFILLASTLQYLWARRNNTSLNNRPSSDQLLETLALHPGAREAVSYCMQGSKRLRLSSGYISGVYYETRNINPVVADEFYDMVFEGLNITEVKSPANRLRNHFLAHQTRKQSLTSIEQAALYIKAFNAHRRGGRGPLQWRPASNPSEEFPVLNAR